MKFTRSLGLLSLLVCVSPLMALKPISADLQKEEQQAPSWLNRRTVFMAAGVLALLYWKLAPSTAASSSGSEKRRKGRFRPPARSANDIITTVEIVPATIPANQLVENLQMKGNNLKDYSGWWLVALNKHNKKQIGLLAVNDDRYQIKWYESRPFGFLLQSEPDGPAPHNILLDERLWQQGASFMLHTLNLAEHGFAIGTQLKLTDAFTAELVTPQPLSAAAAGASANKGAQ